MGMIKVRDGDLGLYLWMLPNGQFLQNESGEFLSLPSRYGDLNNIVSIAQAAKSYGFVNGHAEFISNARQISSSEHDDQMERMLDGKLPDPFDVGALKDEIRNGK